ncbi:3-deoxy-D-manno-octulosonic acid transferase [Tropicibacter oceani]|uniref:3-deoxy-D-manno-octulosonic acid transferase n=1 Tax=Tropicibacter oceani TaxID=3058420 RepID=A0ABY8QHL7_9RHOB|nr:glycosyltransferase N-terminal domain-containing protein [Tropicibacter oceani]WGW03471.1 glycosyltransferase N-terminal domain-containing protein [Tropicibacter oceani]
MKSSKEPLAVLIYRILLSLFSLAVLLRQPGKALRRARLGHGMAPAPGQHVWLHGASNGELASVRTVLDHLVAARPDLKWLITANTPTAVQMVTDWALPGVSARLAPLDLARVTARVLRDWQVVAHVSLESELWPHRFRLCPGPVILLGARMSQGTARGLGRLPGLSRAMLEHVTLAIAQDQGSLDRLTQLGLPQEARGPVVDLKALYLAPQGQTPDAALLAAFPRARTWLAASTHAGEDEIALDAHALALRHAPDLRLILAPRHPRRGDALESLIAARGLTCARRSKGQAPGTAQVYLVDTMGEMALWYALAGRVLVAGTLSDRGGHTPYEPAAFGAALLHGPDVVNHKAGFERLAQAQASVQINDAASLADALIALTSPEDQQRAGKAAQAALAQDIDLDGLCARLLDRLPASAQP